MDFITAHASEVFETLSWKTVVNSYPYLVAEVCVSLVSAHGLFLDPLPPQTPEAILGPCGL